ncbi:nitrate- and nitrite sensing domain-containing protein [Nocardia sp. NPDC059240]|uniref:sensor histidine kinase n=1 Tax=Nocardia sp. NPDC059240 TaxID=3346786 RepID=UPI0036741678
MIMGGTFSAALVKDGIEARQWSDALSSHIPLLLDFVLALQEERTDSLLAATGDSTAASKLGALRTTTDVVLQRTTDVGPELQKLNSEAVSRSFPAFIAALQKLPTIRKSVDEHRATPTDIDGVYSDLTSTLVTGLNDMGRASKDPESVGVEMVAAYLLHAADLHSRSVGLASTVIADDGALAPRERLMYQQFVGGFRSQLDATTPQMTAASRSLYGQLTAGPDWQLVSTADEGLSATGTLSVPSAEWTAAQTRISDKLRTLWSESYRHAQDVSASEANSQIEQSSIAGIAALAVAVVTLLISIRIATSLVRRLKSLRNKTLELAEHTLPSMMQRLQDGHVVDVDSELGRADEGSDELGQVAEAIYSAQRAALTAAAAEAQTRNGFNKVFLDIARRSQVVVHQQLAVLDTAESKQDDPEHLELLFQLDHLATRARRNAENLLILGGGQPGRKWRRPVSLEDIARSAISETRDFARVNAVRLPEVSVHGKVVADLIHLLAELVDNATAFSPPGSPVALRGNLVGNGAVIEIEDQGLGIRPDDRDRLNELLVSPPDFQQMASTGHRQLGLFVVGQLAQRHNIKVKLSESAYGGISAVTLIPAALLDGIAEAQHNVVDEQGFLASNSPLHPVAPTSTEDMPDLYEPYYEPESLLPPQPARESFASIQVEIAPSERPLTVVRTSSSGERGRAPLPKRARQTHLAPQLQIEDTTTQHALSQGPPTSPARAARRSAADARNAMSSLQKGTRQGRGFDTQTMNRNGWPGNE